MHAVAEARMRFSPIKSHDYEDFAGDTAKPSRRFPTSISKASDPRMPARVGMRSDQYAYPSKNRKNRTDAGKLGKMVRFR